MGLWEAGQWVVGLWEAGPEEAAPEEAGREEVAPEGVALEEVVPSGAGLEGQTCVAGASARGTESTVTEEKHTKRQNWMILNTCPMLCAASKGSTPRLHHGPAAAGGSGGKGPAADALRSAGVRKVPILTVHEP